MLVFVNLALWPCLRRSQKGYLRSFQDIALALFLLVQAATLMAAPEAPDTHPVAPRPLAGQPKSVVGAQWTEELVFVPLSSPAGQSLEVTLFRPKGRGPFPLVVMNHGKSFIAPSKHVRARYPVLSMEFLRRGYAVAVPMRQGFSKSGGSLAVTSCDLEADARAQSKDVQWVVKHYQAQPWVVADQVIVIGQSHGGLVTMAYAEQAAPGVRLLVNFAGGLRSNTGRCKDQWEDRLVQAFGSFGKRAQVPSIWFYGQNDSFFRPDLVRKLRHAYSGPARLVAYGAFGQDAHGMVEYSGGVRLWWPELEKEMRRLGLPFRAN
jgi:dienelactone hydrolase